MAKFKKYKNKWKDLEKEFMISAVKKLNVEEVEIKEKSHHDPTLEETCKPRALCLGEVLVPPSWRLSRSSSGSLCDTCSVSTWVRQRDFLTSVAKIMIKYTTYNIVRDSYRPMCVMEFWSPRPPPSSPGNFKLSHRPGLMPPLHHSPTVLHLCPSSSRLPVIHKDLGDTYSSEGYSLITEQLRIHPHTPLRLDLLGIPLLVPSIFKGLQLITCDVWRFITRYNTYIALITLLTWMSLKLPPQSSDSQP